MPNHMYFETDFKVLKMYFQYLNTIFLYFIPISQKNLNFRPCLKYISSVVNLQFMKRKTSLINLQCILLDKYDENRVFKMCFGYRTTNTVTNRVEIDYLKYV